MKHALATGSQTSQEMSVVISIYHVMAVMISVMGICHFLVSVLSSVKIVLVIIFQHSFNLLISHY